MLTHFWHFSVFTKREGNCRNIFVHATSDDSKLLIESANNAMTFSSWSIIIVPFEIVHLKASNLSSWRLVCRAIFVYPCASQNQIMWLTKLKRSWIYDDKTEGIENPTLCIHSKLTKTLLYSIAFGRSAIFTVFALTFFVVRFKWPKVFYMTISIHLTLRQYI